MAAQLWYYRLDGRPHGPFTTIQFEKLIRGQAVLLTTDVSHDGISWRTLYDVLMSGVTPSDPADDASPDDLNAKTLVPGQLVPPPEMGQEGKNGM